MRIFVVDVFTDSLFGGNQAGVVLFDSHEDFLSEHYMMLLAKELKHSETIFIKLTDERELTALYYTPTSQIDFCGHATIAAFELMRSLRIFRSGLFTLKTFDKTYAITIDQNTIFVNIPNCHEVSTLDYDAAYQLYDVMGLDISHKPIEFAPKIMYASISDIIMPVLNRASLDLIDYDRSALVALSQQMGVVGVHAFFYDHINGTVSCRNFAPLYGIDEECATGTSNCGLTKYLYDYGVVEPCVQLHIVQGEKMGSASDIFTQIDVEGNIIVGGRAVVAMECKPFGCE